MDNTIFKKIASAETLELNTQLIKDALRERPELVIFQNNQPEFMILSLDAYQKYTDAKAPRPPRNPAPSLSAELKIGKRVQEEFRRLSYENALPPEELENLTRLDYSNAVFGLNFPVLKKIDQNRPFDEQKRDSRGRNRFYSFALSFNGSQYLLCSQWAEHLHRKKLEAWLSDHQT